MSRNKLYSERIELCVTKEQRIMIEKMSKMLGRRMNEVIREAVERLWEIIH